jgi:hypothetical protein
MNPQETAYYQSLIGVLRWIVELGRVDICLEISIMSSHLALPREGHLEQVCHIFAHLKKYHNTEVVYDPLHGPSSLYTVGAYTKCTTAVTTHGFNH